MSAGPSQSTYDGNFGDSSLDNPNLSTVGPDNEPRVFNGLFTTWDSDGAVATDIDYSTVRGVNAASQSGGSEYTAILVKGIDPALWQDDTSSFDLPFNNLPTPDHPYPPLPSANPPLVPGLGDGQPNITDNSWAKGEERVDLS